MSDSQSEDPVLEAVAQAIHDAMCGRRCDLGVTSDHRKSAAAAIAAYRAQDGGAEETVRPCELHPGFLVVGGTCTHPSSRPTR